MGKEKKKQTMMKTRNTDWTGDGDSKYPETKITDG